MLHAHSNPRRGHLAKNPNRPADLVLEPVRPDPARRMPFPRRAAEALTEWLEGLDVTALPQYGRNATTLLVTINLESLTKDLATATLLAHHWKPWAHGGPTNLNDGGLLCPHHHHVIHTGDFEPEFLDTGHVRLHRGLRRA